jgi:hypothetical protein
MAQGVSVRRLLLIWVLAGAPGAARAADPKTDITSHIDALRPLLPRGFTMVPQAPFVVIGNEPAETVRAHAVHTVKWAVDRLKLDFFARDPERILDIWLFRDRESYERGTRALTGEAPSTPFGFYSESAHGLIMNIATGGGTLVHEIVHPYMDANFPERPAWLNEGMGSLFEQCNERDGHIRGETNWRLPGLQKAIRAGRLPAFPEFLAQSERAFYADPRGTNYGQARYLLYYLQERGLLVSFYQKFHAAVRKDPSGVETLRAVLGERDLDAFQRRWERFVLGLRFAGAQEEDD